MPPTFMGTGFDTRVVLALGEIAWLTLRHRTLSLDDEGLMAL